MIDTAAYLADGVRATTLTLMAFFGLLAGIPTMWVGIGFTRKGEDRLGLILGIGTTLTLAGISGILLLFKYY